MWYRCMNIGFDVRRCVCECVCVWLCARLPTLYSPCLFDLIRTKDPIIFTQRKSLFGILFAFAASETSEIWKCFNEYNGIATTKHLPLAKQNCGASELTHFSLTWFDVDGTQFVQYSDNCLCYESHLS